MYLAYCRKVGTSGDKPEAEGRVSAFSFELEPRTDTGCGKSIGDCKGNRVSDSDEVEAEASCLPERQLDSMLGGRQQSREQGHDRWRVQVTHRKTARVAIAGLANVVTIRPAITASRSVAGS